MRWILSIGISCLVLSSIVYASPVAIFWHGETYQDTLMIERIANPISIELSKLFDLIEPELIRKQFPKEIFENTPIAHQMFFTAYPNGTRIDVFFKKYVNIQTAVVYTLTETTIDSIRFLYPLTGVNTADWFEARLYLHISKKEKRQDIFLGGNSKIVVDGSPIGADVYLNGISTGQKIPCTLDYLLPGTYLVEIIGNYCGAEKVQLLPNSKIGVTIRGKPTPALLEVLSEPSGLDIEVDGVRTDVTPYYRETRPGELIVSVGGGNREVISKRIEIGPLEWKTVLFEPRLMHRVIIYSNPPGAVIYNGPQRIGVSGDTLPCSPKGETWTIDHPLANPKDVFIVGSEEDVIIHHVELKPAEAYLILKNWYPSSTLRYANKSFQVTTPEKFPILAGMQEIEIVTPGYKTKRFKVNLERGDSFEINAEPIPLPNWRSALYSMAVPGLGQVRDGDWIRASLYGTLYLASAVGWLYTEKKLVDEIHSANHAESQYRRALSVHDARYWSATADKSWQNAQRYQNLRNISITSFFVVWGGSVLDRIVFPSRPVRITTSNDKSRVEFSWTIVQW
ncbi:MAG: DUF5683 domain-containing protein [bacterium]|nr:DUF5683 domain-containing protein [bacterium]